MNRHALFLFAGCCLFVSTPHGSFGFALTGRCWPSGDIPLRAQLDATAVTRPFPLEDGTRSWNAVLVAAASEWNALSGRSRLAVSSHGTQQAEYGDGECNVTFSSTTYGMEFPNRALAVAFSIPFEGDRDQVRTVEADIVVNTYYVWNSYRGPFRQSPHDLKRVLMHELGHVLGLLHPDDAGQSVAAIMNSSVGGKETLQPDDIAGYNELYTIPFERPTFTTRPSSQEVTAGEQATLAIAVDGFAPPVADPRHSYRWYFKAAGATEFEPLFTIHRPGSLDFGVVQPTDAGEYYCRALTPDHTVDTPVATLSVDPVPATPGTGLANLSTRGRIGGTHGGMIVGFVVTGMRPKSVLLRAVGPTIGAPPFSVPGILTGPVLILKDSTGATVATSTHYWEASHNIEAVREVTSRVGAFALLPGSRDAVILATLPPGSYTAQIAPSSGGVVLIEAYDADVVRDSTSRLANLSTRAYAGTDANSLIAGFVVAGPGPRTYLVRAVGDTLQDFDVAGTLGDPVLRIYRGDGTLAREYDDWDSPEAIQPTLRAAFEQVGAFPLSDRQEAAALLTLPPGSYTAQITPWTELDGSGGNPGVALVEIYEMP